MLAVAVPAHSQQHRHQNSGANQDGDTVRDTAAELVVGIFAGGHGWSTACEQATSQHTHISIKHNERDAMFAWIRIIGPRGMLAEVTEHPMYFALAEIRPVAITRKFDEHAEDVYDFVAHANPQTTHNSYDQRVVRKASVTE